MLVIFNLYPKLDENQARHLSDREAAELLCTACGCSNVQEIGGWEKLQREAAIRKIPGAGISIRQFSRLTGISKAIIERVLKA